MLTRISKILAAALLCIMLVSTLASCNTDNGPDGYQLIACEGDEFRLYVPSSWQSSTSGGITSAIYSMDDNVTVSVYKVDDAEDMTAEQYWAYCDAKYKEAYAEYSWQGKTEKAVLGGKAAIKTVYTVKRRVVDQTTGEASEVTYKYMQFTVRNGDMFVMLYSAPEDKYEAHLEDVEGDSEGAGIVPYFVFAEAYHTDDNNKEFSGDVTAPDGMKLISTDERAYRFFVPESWTVNNRTDATAAYVVESDGLATNVSVQMYMTGDESQTVSEYWELCQKSYKELFSAYSLVSDEDITMDGISAHKYVYELTVGGIEYKQMQAIVKKGAMFYVVTYTARPEFFDSHTGEVDKMLDAFDIR